MLIELKHRVSHYRWRCIVRRERRRRLRQAKARERDKVLEKEQAALLANPEYVKELEEYQRLEEEAQRLADEEAARRKEEWQLRDAALHSKFLREKEKLRLAEVARQKQEELIKKEWEEKLKKEKEEEEKKNKEQVWTTRHRKRALLEAATENLGKDDDEPTHNPLPPENYKRREEAAEREPCPFFTKTGACRFGVYCSREHSFPSVSDTLMIPNLYSHFGMEKVALDEYDNDASLEYSEQETYEHFRDFYKDTLPEFKRFGSVLQFKVCCNASAHLRGNVYVKFANETESMKAYNVFHGRWYAGRQLTCVFVNITKWKAALCKLFQRNRKGCPKGGQCNFIHAFTNPGNEFWRADLDLPLYGPVYESHGSSKRSDNRSERSRQRSESRSKSRSVRSFRRSWSRSPDDKNSHQSRQSSHKTRHTRSDSSRSHISHKSNSRDLKYSRQRRSRSKSKSSIRSRSRSKSPDVSKHSSGRHKTDYLRSRRHSRSRSSSRSPSHSPKKSKCSKKRRRSKSQDRSHKSNGMH